ncbi:MAG: response regulator transcription factor [Balneolaceae bacterium]|nr:response regulator transcription factor [Balneolaceae bacterium]
MSNIKIAIVDDHKIVRDGIMSLIEEEPGYKIVCEAKNGIQILEECEKQEIDVIIMDITMPKMDGIEATETIKEKYPDIKILALSMLNEDQHIRNMIKAGASGYVLKSTGKKELIHALNTINEDQFYFSDEATQSILHELVKPEVSKSKHNQNVHITDRELEVLKLIVEEHTNQEIADELYISVRTVDAHRRNLLQKIGAKNTAGLVKYALKNNLFS